MSHDSFGNERPTREVPISYPKVKSVSNLKQVECFAEPSLITTERGFDIHHSGEKKQISSPFVQKGFCIQQCRLSELELLVDPVGVPELGPGADLKIHHETGTVLTGVQLLGGQAGGQGQQQHPLWIAVPLLEAQLKESFHASPALQCQHLLGALLPRW